MTITSLDSQPGGGMPSGAVSRGGSPSRGSAVVVGVSTGVVHALVDQVHARLADPAAGVVVGAADVGEVERIARRVEALRLALVARADRQQVHRRTGHSSTSAWVASATRSGGADAARKVQLATALDGEGLAVTRAAFDAGDVSSRCAGIIAATMDKLPETLTQAERAKVETSLVRQAQQVTPGRFYRAAKFALADAERSAAEVAEHVEAQLIDQECRAYRLATVTMQDLGDGTTKLQALLPTFTARMLGKVLQSMTAPRRDHLRQAAEALLVDGQTAAGDLGDGSVAADLHASTRHPAQGTAMSTGDTAGAAFGLTAPADSAEAARDAGTPAEFGIGAAGQVSAGAAPGAGTLATAGSAEQEAVAGVGAGRGVGRNADWADIDWAHRRGRALTELIEHLDTERLTGKVAATVIVTMTIEQAVGAAQAALVQQSVRQSTGTLLEMTPSGGAASTDTGTLISASAARRIACQAGILPAVLGGPGQVLDLGRHHRFFSDPQRTALALIYDTCAADGCDRPFAWSELHHQQPWSKGGLTDLDQAIPLCGYHHRLIHNPRHRHHTTTDSPDGLGNPGAKTVYFHEHTTPGPRDRVATGARSVHARR
ncbi:MAG: DUF222 domain-containing protein [Actinomycetales bacterium]|nr:DUF222 domain-containing protein [Actinomycetales bacterium]